MHSTDITIVQQALQADLKRFREELGGMDAGADAKLDIV
jgi:hypothetical protein